MANVKKVSENLMEELCKTIAEFGGNISRACLYHNVSLSTFYLYKNARAGTPEGMKLNQLLPRALETGKEILLDEARRRAFTGIDEPVIHKGQLTWLVDPNDGEIKPLTVKKYSDSLLMFLIKGLDKRFVDRHEVTGAGGGPLKSANISMDVSNLSNEELDRFLMSTDKLLT